MGTAPLLLLCSALLTQAEGEFAPLPPEVLSTDPPEVPVEIEPREKAAPPPGMGQPGERPEVQPAKEPLPQMRFDQGVQCGYLKPSKSVTSGQYRIQCDDKMKVCLVGSTKVLLDDGVEGSEPLTRVAECAGYYGEDWGLKARAGYRFFPAIAEAPPGWIRDERGRVMQVNFDLHRRVYLGGAYAPLATRLDPQLNGRMRADFGVEIEFPGEEPSVVNRVHLLETEFFLGTNNMTIDATLVRYDWGVARQAPLFWISTFIGTPARHDFSMDAGGWFEALHLESIKRGPLEMNNFITLGSAQLTLDLWHSRDLVSFVRVRGGPAAEVDTQNGFTAFKPQAALEGSFTFDPDGFHHAHLLVAAEKLLFDPVVAGRVQNPSRMRIKAGYELVLIAINDYPVSVLLDGRATWRDDLPGVAPGWEYGGEAGLRFSFWSPARRTALALKAE